MPSMRNVYSSHVDAIGYSPDDCELHVQYSGSNGKLAVYKDVPEHVASVVMTSASIGQALHDHIKGKYEHRYSDD